MGKTTANSPAQSRSRGWRGWLPWVLFAVSYLTMPAVFLVGYLLGSRSSRTPPVYDQYMEITGLCLCGLAPFFTRLPIWLRFLISLFGLLMFAAVYALCVLIALALAGPGWPS